MAAGPVPSSAVETESRLRAIEALVRDEVGTVHDGRLSQQSLDGQYAPGVQAELAGAVGDGTTDDTTAIQSLLTAGYVVLLGAKTYKITAPLVINKAGSGLVGLGSGVTTISQATADQDGIQIKRDGSNFIATWRLSNLIVSGVSAATSTGTGIRHYDTNTSTYVSNRGEMDNISVTGFNQAIELTRGDSMTCRRVHMNDCNAGAIIQHNANSVSFEWSCGNTLGGDGVYVNGVAAVELRPLDVSGRGLSTGEYSVNIQGTSQVVNIVGGNFEGCNGAAFVYVGASARVMLDGARFLKSDGLEVPPVIVSNARLVVSNLLWSGFAATTPTIRKVHLSALVQSLGWHSVTFNGQDITVDEYATGAQTAIYNVPPFPYKIENSTSAANVGSRLAMYGAVGRDASNTEDALYLTIQDKSSGTAAFSRRSLHKVIEGTGTPEGAVAARVGTLFVRTDGGAGTTLYVKESGTSTTGWAAK